MIEEKLEDKINNKINSLYLDYKEDENAEFQISDILYFNDLTLKEPDEDFGIAEQDVFAVKKTNQEEKVNYDLYIYIKNERTQEEERVLIATIDEEGNLIFTENYIEMLKRIDVRFAELINEENNTGNLKLEEVEADKSFSKEELEDLSKELEEKEKAEEPEPENKEDEEIEKIAQVAGIDPSEVRAKSKINPNSRVTEHETFADVTGVDKKYDSIYVINASGDTKQKGNFAFVGITKDGEAEFVDSLQTKGATVTDKNIYSMNRDGSVLEKKQVTEMFSTKDPNRLLSVTIGTYGILDVDYLRRSSEENKYISAPVETEVQRPNNWEVRRLMDSRNTAKTELNEMIDKTEDQLEQIQTANISQIDEMEGNEKYDIDQTIDMGQYTTTIRKEAEKADISPVEFTERIQRAAGNTIVDKVNYVNEDIEKEKREQELGHFHEEDRGERKLPNESHN